MERESDRLLSGTGKGQPLIDNGIGIQRKSNFHFIAEPKELAPYGGQSEPDSAVHFLLARTTPVLETKERHFKCVCSSAGQSICLLSRKSGVRPSPDAPDISWVYTSTG